jgi:predicted amidohydrolase
MKIGYIQTAPVFGEKERNFEAVLKLTENVRADLLVLPELFATGYNFTSAEEVAELAEPVNGRTMQFLRELTFRGSFAIVAGFAEKNKGSLYNSALVIDKGTLVGSYRKLHLFDREKLWFSPGELPLRVFNINGINIGVMICFDWIFPEVCRTLALRGAQVIAHPSNLVMRWCQSAMVTRCLENRVFAVTANRTGNENRGEVDLTFTGMSQVTGVDGTVLSSAPADSPSVVVVEINPDLALNKMVTAHNHIFNDRRPEFYL